MALGLYRWRDSIRCFRHLGFRILLFRDHLGNDGSTRRDGCRDRRRNVGYRQGLGTVSAGYAPGGFLLCGLVRHRFCAPGNRPE